MRKIRKILIITLSVLIVVIMVTGVLAGNYFYDLALNPESDKSVVLSAPHNQMSTDKEAAKEGTDVKIENDKWFADSGYQSVYLTAYDGLKLHAYSIKNAKPSDKWVIVVHGYGGKAQHMTESARKFAEMGYNVLMPDARGHGKSEGDYIGMGWHERLDMVDWTEQLVTDYGDIEIVLYGVSMGGATVMMTSGEELPANVKAIVEDCGYSSVKGEFGYQLEELFNLPTFPILEFSSMVTYFRAGYTLEEGSAVKQVEKSKTPMLFIHGDSDTFVPFSMLDEVYEAANVEKEKLVVEGAGHGEASKYAGDLYWTTIEAFLGRFVTK